jgi:hypothetical protein
MTSRTGFAAGALLLLLCLAACSAASPAAVSPRDLPLPRITSADTAAVRAGKLARYIERRWPSVLVRRAHATGDGTVVAFNDLVRFDRSISDPDAYVRHVRSLTADLDQASVELLQLAVRYFPNLRYAAVWQDRALLAFWSKEQIVAMDRPERYRNHRRFLRLVFSATFPPDGGVPPPPPTS